MYAGHSLGCVYLQLVVSLPERSIHELFHFVERGLHQRPVLTGTDISIILLSGWSIMLHMNPPLLSRGMRSHAFLSPHCLSRTQWRIPVFPCQQFLVSLSALILSTLVHYLSNMSDAHQFMEGVVCRCSQTLELAHCVLQPSCQTGFSFFKLILIDPW